MIRSVLERVVWGGHVRQVISDTERESLLSPKMLQDMRDAGQSTLAARILDYCEPRREAVRGSYGPRLVRFFCLSMSKTTTYI